MTPDQFQMLVNFFDARLAQLNAETTQQVTSAMSQQELWRSLFLDSFEVNHTETES